mmetsp:Transcript_2878/g.4330  ORF Transcript_2878/g.4330 Transcript_2878/m.4330 type:complete len:598 (+) Transcript_2878:200-1993(+)
MGNGPSGSESGQEQNQENQNLGMDLENEVNDLSENEENIPRQMSLCSDQDFSRPLLNSENSSHQQPLERSSNSPNPPSQPQNSNNNISPLMPPHIVNGYDNSSRNEEIRPPPLLLEGNNLLERPHHNMEDLNEHANVSHERGRNSIHENNGAHVDVSVFKYQPGSQDPIKIFKSCKINLRGAALTGGLVPQSLLCSRSDIPAGRSDIVSEYEKITGHVVDRHFIKDHRAKQLLVVQTDDKFMAVAAPEAFSRHSGTCLILGGQGAYSVGQNKNYELKVGSFLRIGSVGLVVCEINTGQDGTHKCLTWEELACLKGDISRLQKELLTMDALKFKSSSKTDSAADQNISPDKKMCYICFDEADTPSNPLIAPCKCKGDTRYLHLNCFQKWNSKIAENKVCVVLNNKGVRACGICMTPYKASVTLPSGEIISLLQSPLPPPYICFAVVTKHQNNENLFSTQFQLSFSSVLKFGGSCGTRPLIIGRSRASDMVLDYRTVSTRHAAVKYVNGKFYYSDMNSSNGSYLYLREPLTLPFGEAVYLKWGSNVVCLKAKQSIRNRINNLVKRNQKESTGQSDMKLLDDLCKDGFARNNADDASIVE